MSQDAKGYLREKGWNWYIKGEDELPPPKPPTHWKYGASHMMIPTLYADLHNKTVEVKV